LTEVLGSGRGTGTTLCHFEALGLDLVDKVTSKQVEIIHEVKHDHVDLILGDSVLLNKVLLELTKHHL
jgi:hypothetical protein